MDATGTPVAPPDPGGLAVPGAPPGYPSAFLTGKIAEISLFVSGEPVPKGRPRFRRLPNSTHVQTYTDQRTATYEQSVGWQVRDQITRLTVAGQLAGIELPLCGRVLISLRFNFVKPKSYPKKRNTHLVKPDFDNLAKSVRDALQTVAVIKDDTLITDATVQKRYEEPGHPEGVEIKIVGWLDN